MPNTPPELSDFYCRDDDEISRGALLYPIGSALVHERMIHGDISVTTPVSKETCLRFPHTASAPMKPTDPLYVFPKWSFYCKSDSVSELANLIIEGVEGILPRRCRIVTKLAKVKLSVETDSGLNVKIKFFGLPGEPNTYFVVFRKDSGDWFAFHSIYSDCLKHMASSGVEIGGH
jgi:hypothetical protein